MGAESVLPMAERMEILKAVSSAAGLVERKGRMKDGRWAERMAVTMDYRLGTLSAVHLAAPTAALKAPPLDARKAARLALQSVASLVAKSVGEKVVR
jgi:hypothetical protein